MFKSATIRLTGWYLLILMIFSILFSVFMYSTSSDIIKRRFNNFQNRIQQQMQSPIGVEPPQRDIMSGVHAEEVKQALNDISISLIYVNLSVLIFGGLGSYFLARRTLKPLEEAHEAETRFTSDASHELRTPLAVMRSEIEVAMRDENTSSDELREVLSSNLEEVKKLTKLSEMLLDLSRMDNIKLKFSPVDILEVTKSISKDNPRINLKSKKQLIVRANEVALGDLIKILVDNAQKYSPDDSIISIKISRAGSNAKFEITNSGPGIDPDKLPHIFDRFYRADLSRTSGEKSGYGLGLALAKNIVSLHNGSLSASSAPNHNTTFTFTLPLENNFQAKNQN